MASAQTIRLSLAACALAAALVALVRAREVRQHAGRRALPVATAAVSPPAPAPPSVQPAPRASHEPAPPPTATEAASAAVMVDPSVPVEAVALPLLPPLPALSPPAPSESAAPVVRGPRRVPFALLAEWQQPGLCPASAEVSALREKMRSSFREIGSGDTAWTLYLDPRLPEGAEPQLLSVLDEAQAIVGKRLALRSSNPTVFAYADRALMKASACINEDVVAFYDGALHVVLDRPDVLQSVVHEAAHHALFEAGLRAPAWAHEGLAMTVAQEAWWRDRSRLEALAAAPFSLSDMERSIPYKLPANQAVAFYVQSALWVQCLLVTRHWSLSRLLATLRAGSASDAESYDLPELEQPEFLAGCVRRALDGSLQ